MTRYFALACGLLAAACATPGLAQQPRGAVYEFSATWCGPCRQMAPIVEKLSRENLPIVKIDGEQRPELMSRYSVDAYPTFLLIVDGREVERRVGPMSESELRAMVARVPRATAAPAASPQGSPQRVEDHSRGEMAIPVDLGQPGQFQIRDPERSLPETRFASADAPTEQPRRGLRDFLPFGRKKDEPVPEEDLIVRGNDTPLDQQTAPVERSIPRDPMATSVRIRVRTADRNEPSKTITELGSGTVVASEHGRTTILTCAHIFKHYSPEAKIEVDLFDRGRPVEFIGQLISFDQEADLGLISIPTPSPVATTSIAGRNGTPRVADPVVAIGCSGGEPPTMQQLQVTDIDKYDGPNNLLCTGVPVQGRSGGGLFNTRGEIIGVCSAADEQAQRGFYSGLLAIHKMLDECSLTQLYDPAGAALLAQQQQQPPQQSPANSTGSPAGAFPMQDRMLDQFPSRGAMATANVPASQVQNHVPNSQQTPTDVQAGQAEVIVVIRDKNQPNGMNRVVIIHEASPKFMSYLNGELPQGATGMPLPQMGMKDAQDNPPTLASISRDLRAPEPAAMNAIAHQAPRPTGTAAPKSTLVPTTLRQMPQPQRYVRSQSSRDLSQTAATR